MLAQMIQRFKKIWRGQGLASMFLAGSALLGGCAVLGVAYRRLVRNET